MILFIIYNLEMFKKTESIHKNRDKQITELYGVVSIRLLSCIASCVCGTSKILPISNGPFV